MHIAPSNNLMVSPLNLFLLVHVVVQEKLRLSGKSNTCIVITNEETSSSEVFSDQYTISNTVADRIRSSS